MPVDAHGFNLTGNIYKGRNLMQTKVTIKCPIIKGKLTLEGSDTNSREFIVSGSGYMPVTIEASSLGGAVDTLMTQLHGLRLTPDAIARRKARGKARSETLARNASNNGKHSRKRTKLEQTTTNLELEPVS